MEPEFTTISFPASGGPEDGKSIEGQGIKISTRIAWPGRMWTADGVCYELQFDENGQPTHWQYDASKNRAV